MIGYIYLITDTTNNMKYVGQHHYDKEGELDPSYHGSGIIISRIYKERPETLKEEYIKTCYSDSEMNDDEKYYIKLYKTLWPYGYNLTEGGDGCIASEETRKKISESLKGKTLSEEHRKKLSEIKKGLQSGEKHPMFGKHHSEEAKKKISESKKNISDETRKKLSEAKKGKKYSEETKKKMSKTHTNGKLSKIVLQFTLDGEFIREWSSTAEAGRHGFNYSAVAACCRGKQKTAYGFIWRYK